MIIQGEINAGRRVFMDFRKNPVGLEDGFSVLTEETYQYLKNSGAIFGAPIERLTHMNPQAVSLYANHGIDLYAEPLEVAVCAQHCNGGVAVDINWESSVAGLYTAGEAAGTFGVYRPGGSALNSAQVGSMRAAEHIARKTRIESRRVSENTAAYWNLPAVKMAPVSNAAEKRLHTQKMMSKYASFLRNPAQIERMLEEFTAFRDRFWDETVIANISEVPFVHKSYDILVTQIAALSAILLSAKEAGSRGSAMVEGSGANNPAADKVIVTDESGSRFEPVRRIPEGGGWFETVWREFNEKNPIKSYGRVGVNEL